jgi:hypothetical protein
MMTDLRSVNRLNIKLYFSSTIDSYNNMFGNGSSSASLYEMSKCFKLNLIALFCAFLFLISLYFNTTLLYTLLKHKDMKSNLNLFIICLSFINLIGTLVELPVVVINNFYCRYFTFSTVFKLKIEYLSSY